MFFSCVLLAFVAAAFGAYFPPIARGPQWSKSLPGGPDGKWGSPTVRITIGDRLPNVTACLADRLIFCNISPSGRTYVLSSVELRGFASGLLTPLKHAETPSLSTSYKYWLVGMKPGVYSYFDLKSRENATLTVLPSAAHNASFYDRERP